MIRHTTLTLAVLAAVLLVGLTGPVAAQQGTTTPNATDATETERIDAQTTLLDSRYNATTGMAYVEIQSDALQEIAVTDGSYLMQGGEATTRSVMVKPGETTTIEIPADMVRGYVSLSIGTSQTLYGELIETGQGSLFTGEATWGTAQAAGAAGFAGGLSIVVVLAYWRVRGGKQEVEQVV
ncbi:hypothetical protein HLRTI_001515 [Halorhabdus tiamatea SARL4B]|uniref:Uncharacterized protein n=1 Tax=Halorhabdus tiamatea SARL4B TaxID=1033806 RepID=S6CUC0_9EURY|nr:hypothetical protein [Halorhabdus tiamatea]ERJ06436.1 hypothetical protein HLRTI_001515 [Halorhabdus tiamatea SARL4B]CCQ34324.1 hypothetical protein HTIA_2212 [Halorhabdus tiamatea SARL4B]